MNNNIPSIAVDSENQYVCMWLTCLRNRKEVRWIVLITDFFVNGTGNCKFLRHIEKYWSCYFRVARYPYNIGSAKVANEELVKIFQQIFNNIRMGSGVFPLIFDNMPVVQLFSVASERMGWNVDGD